MWAAVFRQIFAFVLTRRGKRVIAFVGVMLLCFVTTLLIDLKLYLTAGFTGVLATAALLAFLISHFRQKLSRRDRERRQIEETAKRAAAAEARSEKIGKAKMAVAEKAKDVRSGAAGIVAGAKTRFAGARDRLRIRRKRSP